MSPSLSYSWHLSGSHQIPDTTFSWPLFQYPAAYSKSPFCAFSAILWSALDFLLCHLLSSQEEGSSRYKGSEVQKTLSCLVTWQDKVCVTRAPVARGWDSVDGEDISRSQVMMALVGHWQELNLFNIIWRLWRWLGKQGLIGFSICFWKIVLVSLRNLESKGQEWRQRGQVVYFKGRIDSIFWWIKCGTSQWMASPAPTLFSQLHKILPLTLLSPKWREKPKPVPDRYNKPFRLKQCMTFLASEWKKSWRYWFLRPCPTQQGRIPQTLWGPGDHTAVWDTECCMWPYGLRVSALPYGSLRPHQILVAPRGGQELSGMNF
jgi:hypothetical protein